MENNNTNIIDAQNPPIEESAAAVEITTPDVDSIVMPVIEDVAEAADDVVAAEMPETPSPDEIPVPELSDIEIPSAEEIGAAPAEEIGAAPAAEIGAAPAAEPAPIVVENPPPAAAFTLPVEPAQQQPIQQPYAQPNAYAYTQPQGAAPLEAKSKIAAGLLGLFLGALGVHNFYLGYTGKAIVQLLLTLLASLFTCGLTALASGIWAFVESIMILTGSINVDAKGIPLKD